MKLSKSALTKLQDYMWPGNVRELKHVIERAVILNSNSQLKPEDFVFSELTENKITDDILNLIELEKLAIKKAVKKAGGNMTKASEILGISRTTLYFKLSKYGF